MLVKRKKTQKDEETLHQSTNSFQPFQVFLHLFLKETSSTCFVLFCWKLLKNKNASKTSVKSCERKTVLLLDIKTIVGWNERVKVDAVYNAMERSWELPSASTLNSSFIEMKASFFKSLVLLLPSCCDRKIKILCCITINNDVNKQRSVF